MTVASRWLGALVPVLRRVAATLGLALCFTIAAAVGFVWHADTPTGRRLAARLVSRGLSTIFRGEIDVPALTHLHAGQIEAPIATVFDTNGQRVLILHKLRIYANLRRLLESLFFGDRKLTIVIPHIRVERAEVTVIPDEETGEPTIARAFAPVSATDEDANQSLEDDRSVRVWMPLIEVGSAKGRIVIEDAPPFDARVAGVRGQVLVSPKGVAVNVARFGTNVSGLGKADARGTATVRVRSPGAVQATFRGFYGDVELEAFGRIHRNRLRIVLEVPGADPRGVSALVPGWPLRERVSGHVEAQGRMPRLDMTALLDVGSAKIQATGPIWLTETPRADWLVRGTNFDLRSIWPGAPATALDVDTELRAEVGEDKTVITVDGRTQPAVIADQLVPAADIQGTITTAGFQGKVDLHEPNMPVDADVEITSEGKVRIDARAPRFSLSRTRFGIPANGMASAEAHATIEGDLLVAHGTVNVRRFQRDPITLDRLRIEANVRGSVTDLEHLQVRANATGKAAQIGQIDYDNVSAKVSGVWPSAKFDVDLRDEEQDAHLAGRVIVEPALQLDDVAVSLEQNGIRAEGKIRRYAPERGILEVDSAMLTGVGGEVTGSILMRPNLLEAEVSADGVDLERTARALGLSTPVSGLLRMDGEVAIGRDVTRGRVRMKLGNASVGPFSGLSLDASGTLDGQNIAGQLGGILANVGTFGSSWNAKLDGSPLEIDSWERATGKADVTLSDVQLLVLGLILGPDTPIRQIGGRGYARFLVERKDPELPPNVFATAATRDLLLDVLPGRDSSVISIRGIDVHATGGLNGATGDSTGTLLLLDQFGELVTTSGAIRIDMDQLVRRPERAIDELSHTPLDVVVRVPSRRIAELPEFVRPEDLSGSVEATMLLKGTIDEPTVFASAHAAQLDFSKEAESEPVDVRIHAEYDPLTGHFLSQGAATLQNALVARASASGTWLGGKELPWEGEARLELDGLPFSVIPPLARGDMAGQILGTAVLTRNATDSSLTAHLKLQHASVSGVALDAGRFQMSTQGNEVQANLRIEDEQRYLRAELRAGVDWSGIVPSLDDDAKLLGWLQAKDYDASALRPLVGDGLERLTGRVDAQLRFDIEPAASAGGSGFLGGIDGAVSLEEGSALIVPLGLEVRDMNFTATATSEDGKTHFAVRGLRAKARSSKYNLFGAADLELHGTLLTGGTANVEVIDLPLLLQGVSQGRATGRASAKLTRESNYMRVEIDIPELQARLPHSSSRAVFDLSENPDIVVAQYAEEDTSSDDSLPWQLIISLGNDVRIRRSDVDIGVQGSPIVELGRRTDVLGSVSLTPGGRVPILGQVFVIQNGDVHFDTGKASNPRVNVTAEWRAPDGTLVYVDVTGTLNDAQVQLRSDPPLPEPQVFALLLGGSSAAEDPAASSDPQAPGSTAAGAVGIGSGVAALGINELLGDSPLEFRVGTTNQSRPRYTAAVRVGENLWFEASTYTTASPQLGEDARSVVSGTIDYRFTRKWSLRTEIGTAGGALDLLWQHRY